MSEMSLGLSAATYSASQPEAKRYFFDVSILKLVVMSTVTFNLYQIFWFYRNWRLAKERGEDLMPLPRAIFAVFFAYPLFQEVRQIGRTAGVNAAASAGGLAFLFFILQATWRLPDPLWLLGFASVLPLALVQRDIAKVHRSLGVDPHVNDRFTWKNILGVVLGGLWILLAIVGLLLPETGV
jgi:hypothetical protein